MDALKGKAGDDDIPFAEVVSEVTPEQAAEAVLAKIDKEAVEKALKDICSGVVKRFRQELVGENDDVLDRALRKYRSKVARRTWHVSQKWCKWDEEGPVLMPDHTRLYYRKGATEVIVQEFAPQIRLMKFKGALAKRDNTDTEMAAVDRDKIYSYSLALPYIIFIHKFVGGLFTDCYISFCDRPMKRLQEKPLKPYLSNLDSTLKLCHGASFNREELEAGNLVQQVALVLNNFWGTVYSDEWSGHFWESRRHFTAKNDERMRSLEAWQEASIDNPLFVIEDVNWLPHTEENFGDMIVRLFEHDTADSGYQQELYKDLEDNFVNELKNSLTETMQSVEQKAVADLGNLAEQLLQQITASSTK